MVGPGRLTVPEPATARALFDRHRQALGLHWLGGEDAAPRPLRGDDGGGPLAGLLDPLHPRPVQVLGSRELDFLARLEPEARTALFAAMLRGPLRLLIIAGGARAPRELLAAAAAGGVPVLGSPLAASRVIETLSADSEDTGTLTLHGVFMEVLGVGVLLAGHAGIGKSELALELVSRGHRLVADDAPLFQRRGIRVMGTCPPLLRDFIEVRGLGVLNVRAMFGDNALVAEHVLELIIQLADVDEALQPDTHRVEGTRHLRPLLGVDVPEIVLPVAPGRNLAVLVEAAVRSHILSQQGYDAGADFIRRQRAFIDQQQ